MIRMLLATIGMIAVGILVWKLLQRQERVERDEANGETDEHSDGFGW